VKLLKPEPPRDYCHN